MELNELGYYLIVATIFSIGAFFTTDKGLSDIIPAIAGGAICSGFIYLFVGAMIIGLFPSKSYTDVEIELFPLYNGNGEYVKNELGGEKILVNYGTEQKFISFDDIDIGEEYMIIKRKYFPSDALRNKIFLNDASDWYEELILVIKE